MVVSGAVAGAAAGTLVACVGRLVGFSTWVPPYVPAVGVLILAILDVAPRTRAIGLRKWQVPVTWLHRGPVVDSAVWGLALGPGILTYPGSNAVSGLWLTVLLTLDPAAGARLGLAYGASRMLALVAYRFVLALRAPAAAVELQPIVLDATRGVRLASALANTCLAVSLAAHLA